MPRDKAPGPDGYPMEFYKVAWPIVGKDFVTAVQSFFLIGFMPKSTNATIHTLVPKCVGVKEMKDFLPIACINLLYRVISKIIPK
ncbi:hypothetical protein V5N11_009948 [Cardamine amara subsp. amara]|uniref:Reverse transcriptase n=1 Tax=Cardamine amara subsp. amara TaxID=228776 RepID=A0ABD1B462_CARAN